MLAIYPHTHYLGHHVESFAELPGGDKRWLLLIDDWDFNWQGFYTLAEPASVPPFANVKITAVYDNSDGNPKNPNNPIVPVGWGERTIDEMCLAFIGVTIDNEIFVPFPFSEGKR